MEIYQYKPEAQASASIPAYVNPGISLACASGLDWYIPICRSPYSFPCGSKREIAARIELEDSNCRNPCATLD